ncbi:hypothetical protein PVL29_020289 [Vitis rotundifolia]|uniref:Uncharacterized protein n=1 Tax=Vitis rotundifolia TaxID=103349 RepID=A0AA38Z2T0_VITRO|nr:hypothetical protein PVL29_020289 [Vitis rotundifolia]
MWSTIANLKENLNKIALDVHVDDDEELQIHAPVVAAEDPSVSDRRVSHNYAHSNGIDSAYNSEVICLNFASSVGKWNWKVPVGFLFLGIRNQVQVLCFAGRTWVAEWKWSWKLSVGFQSLGFGLEF